MNKKKNNLYWLYFGFIAGLTIVCLIFWILSFESYDDGFGISYSFSKDYMFLTMGAFVPFGVIIFDRMNKTKDNRKLIVGSLGLAGLIELLYGAGSLVENIVEKSDFKVYSIYLIWVVLSAIICIVFGLIYRKIADNKK